MWWQTTFPALKRQRQEECHRLEASLGYVMSLGQQLRYSGTLLQKQRKLNSTEKAHFLFPSIASTKQDKNDKCSPGAGTRKSSSESLDGAGMFENILIDLQNANYTVHQTDQFAPICISMKSNHTNPYKQCLREGHCCIIDKSPGGNNRNIGQ